MVDIVNLQAVVYDYQRKTKSRRMTSGDRRVHSLLKEEKRLNGEKP